MRKLLLPIAGLVLAGCMETPQAPPVMVPGGNAERGRVALRTYGCGSCHKIPGVPQAVGLTGPPLTSWNHRTYIAGSLFNSPPNFIRWVMFPDSIEPGTAMPTLGVTPQAARDMAAYLYTLTDAEGTGPPHLLPVRWLHRGE